MGHFKLKKDNLLVFIKYNETNFEKHCLCYESYVLSCHIDFFYMLTPWVK
jgi:hypothetical protein